MIDATLQRRQIDVQVLKKHFPNCAKIFDQIEDTKRSEATYKDMKRDLENSQTTETESWPVRIYSLPSSTR